MEERRRQHAPGRDPPAGADLETFDYRISLANVASDGPFSFFSGVDRTLALITGERDGDGLELSFADSATHHSLTPQSAPLVFAGELAVVSRLTGGPVLDFNVMTRRARCRHRVSELRLTEALTLAHGADTFLLLAAGDACTANDGFRCETLARLDALSLAVPGVLTLTPHGPCRLFRIEILPAGA
ncbi:HutD/Ves family protein [Crenobacter cavernae]|uniref:HutD family protein n=1 Tax=Crenobacter cavernae TaxID=2290923 RepID=A0A345Y8Z0_9NEIS|nr:HutD family protein [Crenobacter cavernae]AXK40392.1 HutD family protein [Crenobacter cavernae]